MRFQKRQINEKGDQIFTILSVFNTKVLNSKYMIFRIQYNIYTTPTVINKDLAKPGIIMIKIQILIEMHL